MNDKPMSQAKPASQVLEEAHDAMKANGRATATLVADDGRVCLIGALGVALGFTHDEMYEQAPGSPIYLAADTYTKAMGFTDYIQAYRWNDGSLAFEDDAPTTEDVLDRFMQGAKDLRDKGL